MPLAVLGLCLWWPLARLGLCLAGVDHDELTRLKRQGIRRLVVLLGTAACLVVLAGGVAAGAGQVPPQDPASHGLGVVAEVISGVATLPTVAGVVLWLWVRTMTRRAIRDRERAPVLCRGTVRRILRPGAGGWPVLVRRDSGRGRWLTGSVETLAPIRGRLPAGRDRAFRVTVTLTYYRRSRVIKEIDGVVVEDLAAAWEMPGLPVSGS
jgi:hypothetical protein